VPLSLEHYVTGWCLHQERALAFRDKHKDRVHLVRYEDVIADPERVLGGALAGLGLSAGATLREPSWNGTRLEQVYPWGTIRTPTPAANRATAEELSPAERDEIQRRARPLLAALDYA
jgi:hypothetical protein